MCHLNIEKENVELGPIAGDELSPIFEDADGEAFAAFLFVASKVVRDEGATGEIIFDNSNANQGSSLPLKSAVTSLKFYVANMEKR